MFWEGTRAGRTAECWSPVTVINIKAEASDKIEHELQERYMTGSTCWPFKGDTVGNGVVITECSLEYF